MSSRYGFGTPSSRIGLVDMPAEKADGAYCKAVTSGDEITDIGE